VELCGILEKENIEYRFLDSKENQSVFDDINSKLQNDDFNDVSEENAEITKSRHTVWNSVWDETFEKYAATNFNDDALNPKFVGGNHIFRLKGRFAESKSLSIEFLFYKLARTWMIKNFLQQVDEVWELGCGSGFNIAYLADQMPQKKIFFFGLDWAKGSQKILDAMAVAKKVKISGGHIDFFNPPQRLSLKSAAVFTFCALEQIGHRHKKITETIIASKPKFCIHMEPIIENYDPNDAFDKLAYDYHIKRGYLNGFKQNLYRLQDKKRIEILYDHRMYIGSYFHEGFNLIVWTPT
jgi:hypothetical protein